jgi:hypothetical protein
MLCCQGVVPFFTSAASEGMSLLSCPADCGCSSEASQVTSKDILSCAQGLAMWLFDRSSLVCCPSRFGKCGRGLSGQTGLCACCVCALCKRAGFMSQCNAERWRTCYAGDASQIASNLKGPPTVGEAMHPHPWQCIGSPASQQVQGGQGLCQEVANTTLAHPQHMPACGAQSVRLSPTALVTATALQRCMFIIPAASPEGGCDSH